jgi:hypothetical protein
MLMVDLQGLQEYWHFKEKGDLGPLLSIMDAGTLAPVVQQMMAKDLRHKQRGAYYLAVERHRGEYGRAGRLFEVGQQISDWTREYKKQDAAIAQALKDRLISNETQGHEALNIYRKEMDRRAREDRDDDD